MVKLINRKYLLQEVLSLSKLVSFLYKLARTANDAETLASSDSKRIASRIKNKVVGRKLMRKLMK